MTYEIEFKVTGLDEQSYNSIIELLKTIKQAEITSSQNNGKPLVSGSLPALVGLSEYINNSYDFSDGYWYWKVDVEGDCPLSIEQVIANFISRQ